MEPAPPRAPISIRIWGWILLASSVLNLIAFATSSMGTLASGGAPGISSLAVVAFLVTVATGIGFVSGWRWSWYTGVLIAVGGLAFGVWYLQQVRGPGASDIRPVLGVIWLGPSLVLLLCLLFPSAIRWMRGGEQPWRWPMPPPGTPAATIPTPEAIVHRLAVYEDGDVSAEVRLFEVDLSRWPHETLLASAGVSVGAGRVSAETVNGVAYTCARMRRGSACVWTDGSWTGWARSDGPLAVDRLRDLARSAHSDAT